MLLSNENSADRTLYWYYEKPKPSPKGPAMRSELAIRKGKWMLVTRLDGSESYLFDIVNDPSEEVDISQNNRGVNLILMHMLNEWYAAREP